MRHSSGDATLHFIPGKPIAAAIVLESLFPALGIATALIELGGRTEATIRSAAVEQSLGIGLVTREIGTLVNDAVVPVEAQPLESFEDSPRALVGAARLVSVLDAQQELAAIFPGVEPVEKCRARAADVEIPCRRWSEAKSRFGSGHWRAVTKSGSGARTRRAEREGFEPSIRVSTYAGLANRCLQPLGHLSGRVPKVRQSPTLPQLFEFHQ